MASYFPEPRGGLAGKILRVDLTTRKISFQPTVDYARRWIGGRTISSYILLRETDPEVTWADPENPLIFGTGALVGTTIGANRVSVETKNVYTNGKGSSNVGGHFGPELKFAGFDHIVVTGRADRPVYIWISDGTAEIREADHLWGKTVSQTEEALRAELGDSRVRVACIGPAGERLVRGSAIMVDQAKAAGGSGVGCVMGSKNLKALVAHGTGTLSVARPQQYLTATDAAVAKVKASPSSKSMAAQGLAATYYSDPAAPPWDLLFVVRNGQDDYWPIEKRRRAMNAESGVPSYRTNMLGCTACPIGCMPFFAIREGRYRGTTGEGFWVNTLMSASFLDLPEPDAMIKAWLLMNDLGLDADFAVAMLGWAFECFERGILTLSDTDGVELTWGNSQAVMTMLKKLAYREGLGDLLANGPMEAAKQVGQASSYYAIHVKGQPSIEPFRIPKGWALGVATSPIAGRHLRGSILRSARFGPKGASFEPHVYEDQPKYVFWQGLTKEIEDTTGICVYVGTWSGARALDVSDYVALTNSVMGFDLTEEEFMRFAEKGRNLEKAFNTLHTDLDRSDDLPPQRYIQEPVKSGPYKGYRCDPSGWDQMLDEYYRLHRWDKATGLQTRACLERLDMDDVAAMLEQAGRLVESS